MQLYSVEQQRSQALDAHAAAFGSLKVRQQSRLSVARLTLPQISCPATRSRAS